MDRLVDVDAFLLGTKPAHYGNTGCPTTMKHIDKLKCYPYVTDGIDISDNEYFLFFQNNELKSDFLDKLHDIVPRSPEFHELLGITIGYPPAAARFFAKCQMNPNLENYRLAIHYAGIRCVSHADDLIQNAQWLWNHYTEDADMRILIETTLYPVQRGDISRLNEIRAIKWDSQVSVV